MHNQAQKGIRTRLQQQFEQGPILVDNSTIAQLNKPSELNAAYVTRQRPGWRASQRGIVLCGAIVLLTSLAVALYQYWTFDRIAALDRENQVVSFSLPGADKSMGMGWGCRNPEECKAAIVSLTRVIAQKPNSSNAFCKRAWIYDTMGLYEQAVQDASQAILFNSRNADAYEARSYAYAHLGQQDNADLDLDKADCIPTDPH